MNAATILACIAFTALFGVAWFIAEAIGQRNRRLAQRVAERPVWKCSWCLKDLGINPQPNETHGLCQMHFDQQMAEVPDACKVEPPF